MGIIVNFSTKVKNRMEEMSLTNCQLSKELGISQSYLSEILNEKKMGITKRVEIANYLNIELSASDLIKKGGGKNE